jgi:hypothetical protein
MNDKIDDFTIYGNNPFFKEVRDSNIIQSKDKKNSIPTSASLKDHNGKSLGPVFIKQNIRKYSDVREFARIPMEGLMMISTFEKPELKIFCYILLIIEYNSLEIELQVEKIKNYFSYNSRNPIYKGIIGLLNKGIIARSEKKYYYYVNPLYFYKGTIIKEFFTICFG